MSFLSVLILICCTPTGAAPGEGRYPQDYYDRLYSGILNLIDGHDEAALADFNQAAIASLGVEGLQNELKRLEESLASSSELEPLLAGLKRSAGAPEILRYFFLSKLLSQSATWPPKQRVDALRQITGLNLAGPPWNMPEDISNALKLRLPGLLGTLERMKPPAFQLEAETYEAMIDWEPKAAIVQPPYVWLLKTANRMFDLKEYDRAHERYRRYLKQAPYSSACDGALLNLGKCLVSLKRYDDGYALITKLCEEMPASPLAKKASRPNYVPKTTKKPDESSQIQ